MSNDDLAGADGPIEHTGPVAPAGPVEEGQAQTQCEYPADETVIPLHPPVSSADAQGAQSYMVEFSAYETLGYIPTYCCSFQDKEMPQQISAENPETVTPAEAIETASETVSPLKFSWDVGYRSLDFPSLKMAVIGVCRGLPSEVVQHLLDQVRDLECSSYDLSANFTDGDSECYAKDIELRLNDFDRPGQVRVIKARRVATDCYHFNAYSLQPDVFKPAGMSPAAIREKLIKIANDPAFVNALPTYLQYMLNRMLVDESTYNILNYLDLELIVAAYNKVAVQDSRLLTHANVKQTYYEHLQEKGLLKNSSFETNSFSAEEYAEYVRHLLVRFFCAGDYDSRRIPCVEGMMYGRASSADLALGQVLGMPFNTTKRTAKNMDNVEVYNLPYAMGRVMRGVLRYMEQEAEEKADYSDVSCLERHIEELQAELDEIADDMEADLLKIDTGYLKNIVDMLGWEIRAAALPFPANVASFLLEPMQYPAILLGAGTCGKDQLTAIPATVTFGPEEVTIEEGYYTAGYVRDQRLKSTKPFLFDEEDLKSLTVWPQEEPTTPASEGCAYPATLGFPDTLLARPEYIIYFKPKAFIACGLGKLAFREI